MPVSRRLSKSVQPGPDSSTLGGALLAFPLTSGPLTAASPADETADAASHFLAALTPDQKAKATYEFKDEERFDWHFIPKPRKGLPFKDMTSPQRLLAHALLNSGLS